LEDKHEKCLQRRVHTVSWQSIVQI